MLMTSRLSAFMIALIVSELSSFSEMSVQPLTVLEDVCGRYEKGNNEAEKKNH